MKNKKIAIIDNDKKSLKNLEDILAGGGYTPIPIRDAFLAVDVVKQNKPDLILMELRMPHKNGFEITDALNRVPETREVPIIAMSESFKNDFIWLFDLCGIKRCIKKPLLPLNVIWAIENEIEDCFSQELVTMA